MGQNTGAIGGQPYIPYTPQTQVPQNTMSPPMDSTMVDDFGSRSPSIFNPGMQGGLGQTPSPFRSVLPIFTQSGQANAVFDPSSDPRIALANNKQFQALKRQQQYVTDPMQELYKRNFVNRYMEGRTAGRDMQGMPTGMTFQQMPITVGDRTKTNYYQANPLTGMAGTGMAGMGIAGLLR
jgi:hypothetical protein